MPNPGQPTIRQGDTGDAVRRLQRALFRNANHQIQIDGIFGWQTADLVVDFQKGYALSADGVVGPATWHRLPGGGPMPLLAEGSKGKVVQRLQIILNDGASRWGVPPQGIDGEFGPNTRVSVQAFQRWGGATPDGIVGDSTWRVLMGAADATLESVVGIEFVTG